MLFQQRYLSLLAAILLSVSGFAQLTVDTAMSPDQMVQNLVGEGVQIFNVQVTAAPNSFGYYTSSNTEIGTNQGLLLTTGRAVNAIGPNNSSGLPQILSNGTCANCNLFDNNFPGSPLLNAAQDRTTFDATMIEFDIIPQGDSLSFGYTFASEEYLEWVNSPFNDVFGFYISGTNIGNDVNIALLPGTSQAVAINSVNHLVNSQYFDNNITPPGQFIQYDGLTVDLVAAIGNLVPCEVYHLKLIIADGSDRLYDSGVFVRRIESNPVIVLTATAGGIDYMIEGCNNGTISFCREFITPDPVEVAYWFGGTAVNGADYSQIGTGTAQNPNIINIPGNEQCISIPVNTIDDGILEGEEIITIYVGNPLCDNLILLDSTNFSLVDQLEVALVADPVNICAGQCVTLTGTAIIDGTSSFTWSPLDGIADPESLVTEACPTETTTYTLTSQIESCLGEASVTIEVSSITISLDAQNDNCAIGNTGSIGLSIFDAVEPFTFEWTGPDGFTSDQQDLDGLAPGQYCVTVTDGAGCVASGCATIAEENTLQFAFEELSDYTCFPISCFGATDGSVNIEITGGSGIYTYAWTGPDDFTADTQDISGLGAGVYTVTVTDSEGCVITDSFTLEQPAELTIDVLGVVDLLCTGVETGSAEVDANGGCSPYFYTWSHDPTLQGPLALNLGSGVYNVSVEDVNGCSNEGSVEIEINEPIDPVSLTIDFILTYPGGFNVSCPGESDGAVDVTIEGGTLPYSIVWDGPGTFTSGDEDLLDVPCGDYTLTVTDGNNCVIAEEVALSCVAPIQITSSTTPNPCNEPENTLGAITILTTTGGHGGPYVYEWSGPDGFSSFSEDLTGLVSGAYTLLITDPFGCTEEITINVGTNNAFTADATVTQINCANACNGSILLDVSPADVYTYTWTGPDGPLPSTQDQTGLCPGNYSVLIQTDECEEEFQYLITEPTPIEIDVVEVITPVCFGQNSGSIDIEVSGGTGNLTISWAPLPSSFFAGSANEDLSNLFDGCYVVTVTDENGCTATEEVCLNAPQVMTISVEVTQFNGGFNISCPGAQDGQISVFVAGGTPDCDAFAPFCYEYDWSGCADVAPNDPNSNILTGLSGGVYCVDVFDTNGCLATTTITMLEPEPIADNAIVEDVTCNGANDGSITPNLIGGSGTYIDFDWTQGNIGSNAPDAVTLTNLAPGCYTLVVTDNNQCNEEFTWCISEPPPLTISVGNVVQPACDGTSGGSATLNAQGGTPDYTYVTTGPGGPYTGPTLDGLDEGIYDVTVTDANGCTAAGICTINPVVPLEVSIEALIADPGQVFTLQCFGDTTGSLQANITGGSPEYTITWTDSNGDTIGSEALITNLGAGEYCVQVVDQNGCETSTCFTITQPEEPLVTEATLLEYLGYNVSCFGVCDGAIDLTVTGGVAPYLFLWELGTGELVPGEDQTDLCDGLAEVLVTDANGCQQLNQFNLTTPAPINPNATLSQFDGGFNVSCIGSCDGSITVTATGDDGPFTVQWTNPVLPGGDTQENLCAGAYEVAVTDSRGCTETETFTLIEPTAVSAVIQTDFDCDTGEITLCAVAGGGSGSYTFNWSDESGNSCVTPQNDGEYCVTVTDSNGCSFEEICETVADPELLDVSGIVTNTTCGQANGAIDLTIVSGTGPFDLVWTGNGVVQDELSQSDLATGNYTVTVTDAFGCSVTLPFQVQNSDQITVFFDSTNPACFGESSGSIEVTINNAAAPIQYSWTLNGLSYPGEDQLDDVAAGIYTLTWSDADGCTGSSSVIISQPDTLTINADILLYGNGFNMSGFGETDGAISTDVQGGTPQYTYDWNIDALDQNEGGINLAPGTYTLTVTDANGCTADTVIVLTEPFDITLPTGLSPNGDGDNDTYVILGIEAFPNNEFKVFNRWGNIVYEKTRYNNEWGGESKNGEALTDGTYFVVFVAGGLEFNTYVDLRR